MKKQLVRIAASALVALALASATHGTNASADGRAVSTGDGVSQSAGATTLVPPSGFVPNPQALLPSQVKFPATRFSAIDLRVAVALPDRDLVHKLLTIAEHACLVTNTLKAAMPISIDVDGAP